MMNPKLIKKENNIYYKIIKIQMNIYIKKYSNDLYFIYIIIINKYNQYLIILVPLTV